MDYVKQGVTRERLKNGGRDFPFTKAANSKEEERRRLSHREFKNRTSSKPFEARQGCLLRYSGPHHLPCLLPLSLESARRLPEPLPHLFGSRARISSRSLSFHRLSLPPTRCGWSSPTARLSLRTPLHQLHPQRNSHETWTTTLFGHQPAKRRVWAKEKKAEWQDLGKGLRALAEILLEGLESRGRPGQTLSRWKIWIGWARVFRRRKSQTDRETRSSLKERERKSEQWEYVNSCARERHSWTMLQMMHRLETTHYRCDILSFVFGFCSIKIG